jgi:hypothetical protein
MSELHGNYQYGACNSGVTMSASRQPGNPSHVRGKRKVRLGLIATSGIGWLLCSEAGAEESGLIFNNRTRYETIEQKGYAMGGEAITARTQLGWQSLQDGAFRFLVEGEVVSAFKSDYNSTVNGKTQYPVIADPKSAQINRLMVVWRRSDETELTLGRQTVIIDNGRFVGDANFRQTEQTFDGLKVTSLTLRPLNLTYGHFRRVNRVFGNESPQGHWDGNLDLFHVSSRTPVGLLSAYVLLMNFDLARFQSTATTGGRLSGERVLSESAVFTYAAEWAGQHDYRSNPAHFNLTYYGLSGGVKKGAFVGNIAFEQLGSDGIHGFQTPLHGYQSWADVFWFTPATGLADTYVTTAWNLASPLGAKTLRVFTGWHDFRAATGTKRYGHEINAAATLQLTNKLAVAVQTSVFSSMTPEFAGRTRVSLSIDYSY